MKKLLLILLLASGVQQAMAQAARKVLVEEYTGVWCGYCPNGITAMEQIATTYPNSVIEVAMHGPDVASDPMGNGYASNVITALNVNGYYPSASIDRGDYGGDAAPSNYYQWATYVGDRVTESAPLNIAITSTYNSSTRAISITVTANFVGIATGDMRISCLLVEDKVTGNSSYSQHNYMGPGCGSTDTQNPWYSYPCYIATTSSGFTHRNVVRANLAPIWGTAGVIPNTGVTAGQHFSKTYTTTLNAAYNSANMKVVAFVSHYSTDALARDVLNAQEVALGQSVTAVPENPAAIDNVTLDAAYPNPFSDVTHIRVNIPATQHVAVKIYDLLGHEVAILTDGNLSPGEHILYWDGKGKDGAAMTTGLYLVRVQTGKQSLAKSIILQRN